MLVAYASDHGDLGSNPGEFTFKIFCHIVGLNRCSMTTMVQEIPFHEMPLNQELLKLQGELYPSQSTFNHHNQDQLLKFPIIRVSTGELAASSLPKRISSIPNFHESTGTDRARQDSNLQPLTPKASAVSIELTWLLLVRCAHSQSSSLSFCISSVQSFCTCTGQLHLNSIHPLWKI